MKLPSILIAALLAGGSGRILAALTAYDGFAYTAGDLTGKSGGSGWSGAYTDSGNGTVAETVGLTYGDLLTTAGSARTADGGTATTISFRSFDNVYDDSETETWISFLARRNGSTDISKFAGISFYNTAGNGAADGEFSIATNNPSNLVWRILDPGTNTSALTANSLQADATDFLVTRIQWGAGAGGTDIVSLFVNPALDSSPTTTSATKEISMTNFDKVRIAGQNGVDYSFDELRVGGTFRDVAPVPEPSAAVLLLPALGLLGRRRRGQ